MYCLYRSTNLKLREYELKIGRSLFTGETVVVETPLKKITGEGGHWTFTRPDGMGFTIKPHTCENITITIPMVDGNREIEGFRVRTKNSEHLFYEYGALA